MRLAVMTFGLMRAPWGHARVAGFETRIDGVFALADGADGFIARSHAMAVASEAQRTDGWGSVSPDTLLCGARGFRRGSRGEHALTLARSRGSVRLRVRRRPPRCAQAPRGVVRAAPLADLCRVVGRRERDADVGRRRGPAGATPARRPHPGRVRLPPPVRDGRATRRAAEAARRAVGRTQEGPPASFGGAP